jgi:hypothetical protein
MKFQNKFLLCFLLSLTSICYSGTVAQVKNNKALVDFKDESVSVGDQFFILSADNKKIAIIQITVVKNNKAVGDVLKGAAIIGGKTQIKSSSSITSVKSGTQFIRHDLMQIGFHLKYMMNGMSTKQEDSTSPFPNKETVNMKGSDIGIGSSLDIPVYDWLKASGYVGYETLTIAGTAQFNSCSAKSSTDCNVKITYLNLSGLFKFDLMKSKTNLWAGLGGAYKYPIAKKSTALSEDNIQAAQSLIAAFGMDYHLNNKSYVPVSFEYHRSFNMSDTVPVIDQMNLLVGYGIKF